MILKQAVSVFWMFVKYQNISIVGRVTLSRLHELLLPGWEHRRGCSTKSADKGGQILTQDSTTQAKIKK